MGEGGQGSLLFFFVNVHISMFLLGNVKSKLSTLHLTDGEVCDDS